MEDEETNWIELLEIAVLTELLLNTMLDEETLDELLLGFELDDGTPLGEELEL